MSAKDRGQFEQACGLAEDLLRKVYKQYAQATGNPRPEIMTLEQVKEQPLQAYSQARL